MAIGEDGGRLEEEEVEEVEVEAEEVEEVVVEAEEEEEQLVGAGEANEAVEEVAAPGTRTQRGHAKNVPSMPDFSPRQQRPSVADQQQLSPRQQRQQQHQHGQGSLEGEEEPHRVVEQEDRQQHSVKEHAASQRAGVVGSGQPSLEGLLGDEELNFRQETLNGRRSQEPSTVAATQYGLQGAPQEEGGQHPQVQPQQPQPQQPQPLHRHTVDPRDGHHSSPQPGYPPSPQQTKQAPLVFVVAPSQPQTESRELPLPQRGGHGDGYGPDPISNLEPPPKRPASSPATLHIRRRPSLATAAAGAATGAAPAEFFQRPDTPTVSSRSRHSLSHSLSHSLAPSVSLAAGLGCHSGVAMSGGRGAKRGWEEVESGEEVEAEQRQPRINPSAHTASHPSTSRHPQQERQRQQVDAGVGWPDLSPTQQRPVMGPPPPRVPAVAAAATRSRGSLLDGLHLPRSSLDSHSRATFSSHAAAGSISLMARGASGALPSGAASAAFSVSLASRGRGGEGRPSVSLAKHRQQQQQQQQPAGHRTGGMDEMRAQWAPLLAPRAMPPPASRGQGRAAGHTAYVQHPASESGATAHGTSAAKRVSFSGGPFAATHTRPQLPTTFGSAPESVAAARVRLGDQALQAHGSGPAARPLAAPLPAASAAGLRVGRWVQSQLNELPHAFGGFLMLGGSNASDVVYCRCCAATAAAAAA